jgi:hypothetical protein
MLEEGPLSQASRGGLGFLALLGRVRATNRVTSRSIRMGIYHENADVPFVAVIWGLWQSSLAI